MSGDNFLFDGEGFDFSHLLGMVRNQQAEAHAKNADASAKKAEQTRKRAAAAAAASNDKIHAELQLIREALDELQDARNREALKPKCPVCGGILPGIYRKCMHCGSGLAWLMECECQKALIAWRSFPPQTLNCPACRRDVPCADSIAIPCEDENAEELVARYDARVQAQDAEKKRKAAMLGI